MSNVTINLVAEGPRRCGQCSLCCKLLPMGMGPVPRPDEFRKPAGERCPHQRAFKGCAVYEKRPACCALWNCRWLGNAPGTEGMRRPDRSHYVLDVMPDAITLRDPIEHGGQEAHVEVIQVWVDPGYPDAHKDPALRAYLAKLGEEGIAALIRYSNKDGFVLFPPAMTQTGDWHEEHSGQTMPEDMPSRTHGQAATRTAGEGAGMMMLLVMRLADMTRVHPRQDNSRVCSRCKEQVGIYPSGQEMIRRKPAIEIVCQVCAAKEAPPDIVMPAPGSLEEPRESHDRKEQ